jgi:hypothetical protein
MYSGMVYPPAFGVPHSVTSMLQTNLTVRASVCAIGIALALFFLTVGLFMRKNRAMLLFGAVCFCFVGYVCYPVIKTIFRGGMWWYGFENFCFCAMLLLTMLLQRTVYGNKSKLSNIFIIFGIFVCAFSVLRTALPSGNLHVLTVYSLLIGLYKWVAAIFLTISVVRAVNKTTMYGFTILCGVFVFDCGLVMDRLFPLFEPIRFGWFAEIGGFAIVVTLGVVMGQEVLRQYREKLALEGKVAGVESLVEMQREYYPIILESIEATRRARHDLHHHIHVMRGLVSSGKYSELEIYLRQYSSEFFDMSPLTYCENDIVDVILRHFAALATKVSVCFNVDVDVPETLSVENADLCAVIGNLLENALEACAYVKSDKRINIIIKQIRNELVILVDNTFDGSVVAGHGTLMSRKRRKHEGVGLASVRAVAERYSGGAEFRPDVSNRVFHSEVILKRGSPTTQSAAPEFRIQ